MITTYHFGKQPPLLSIALFCPNKVCAIPLCIADRLPGKYNGYYYLTDFVILELHNFMCEIVRALLKITPKENGGVLFTLSHWKENCSWCYGPVKTCVFTNN